MKSTKQENVRANHMLCHFSFLCCPTQCCRKSATTTKGWTQQPGRSCSLFFLIQNKQELCDNVQKQQQQQQENENKKVNRCVSGCGRRFGLFVVPPPTQIPLSLLSPRLLERGGILESPTEHFLPLTQHWPGKWTCLPSSMQEICECC